jgi:D-glycero-alpha-D-manno-heptose-7-phosphate kinase
MIIESTAPTRVDLAGGTIDIWPLYLFHQNAATVNFAVDLYARCRIETRDDDRIILESRDRNLQFETRVSDIEQLVHEQRLELISKLVHFFKPETGFHLTASAESPAGAGLGGSSALAIACIGALNRLVGDRHEPRKFITIAANVETTVIRVPAGFQDYLAAFYGGANCFHFRAAGIEREELRIDSSELERRLRICYTGEPRLSGTNNWEIFKTHIDGDEQLFRLFENIRDSVIGMRTALLAGDYAQVAEVMRGAYPTRKQLAPGVTTPHMEMLVAKAMRNGAEAAKVCGAGGGGCIAFLCDPERTVEVERALTEESGVEMLEWRFAREGLTVSES